jgi:sugar lactone lactonase YvrE
MITSDTVVSTVAGDTIVGNTDGIGSAARFSYPYGLTWLNNRELLIVDMVGKKIRKLNILTKAVTTVSSITYNNPQDIAIDALGNMYVSGLSGYIVKIENGAVKDFAGLSGSTGTTDGNGTAARFMRPVGMVYINNTLYVADLEGHTIRKITTPTTSVDELALSTTMNMYPNPASNKVTLLNVHEGQKVALYNVQGVQIAEFISEGTKIELDLSAYAKGVYLLKSVHNGSVSNAKLLVE